MPFLFLAADGMQQRPRVVIVGGGFGGLYAAKRLGAAAVDLTVVDRRNFHLFQPLLYQVATGGLSPANIAAPLRAILRKQQNTRVFLAEVTGVDVPGKSLLLGSERLPYDFLIVAAGARHQYFGRHEWEPHAPGLKTIEDAVEIRRRILSAFEAAEREADPQRRAAWMTVGVVGAGPTGGEMAGASLAELAEHTLRGVVFARSIPAKRQGFFSSRARIAFCQVFRPRLSKKAAAKAAGKLGVTVHTCTARLRDHRTTGDFQSEREIRNRFLTRTVLWASRVCLHRRWPSNWRRRPAHASIRRRGFSSSPI